MLGWPGCWGGEGAFSLRTLAWQWVVPVQGVNYGPGCGPIIDCPFDYGLRATCTACKCRGAGTNVCISSSNRGGFSESLHFFLVQTCTRCHTAVPIVCMACPLGTAVCCTMSNCRLENIVWRLFHMQNAGAERVHCHLELVAHTRSTLWVHIGLGGGLCPRY